MTPVLLLLLTSISQAVPLQLTQQGRVLDNNGAAVIGLHDITFRIYDAQTGGTLLWEEPITENFTNGYYAAVLGADPNHPLDSSTLSLYPLYLEIQIDSNTPMSTRQAINSAPYAQIAGISESVDGGVVNASEIQINTTQVIDGSGNWVGQPITISWNDIDPSSIPSDLADGDDNTHLDEPTVEGYITNGAINLAANSEMNGDLLLTETSPLEWSHLGNTIPSDLADGDDDTLTTLSCQAGEIIGWDGSWTCVSDNTLDVSDIQDILYNHSVDLNPSTTIGGLDIITSLDDSDTLASLSCGNDGEIARYDLALDQWYCDSDNDTDTQLNELQVEGYITNSSINLAGGSQMNSRNIIGQPSVCSDGQVLIYNSGGDDWDCGDIADSDTLNSLNCSTNESIQWDGSAWTCVSNQSSSTEVFNIGVLNPNSNTTLSLGQATEDILVSLWAQNTNGEWETVNTSSSSIAQDCTECGNGSDGAFTPSSNITLPGGEYNFTTINIPNGVTISTSGADPLILRANQSVTIDGNIDVTPGTAGGGTATCSSGTCVVSNNLGVGSYSYECSFGQHQSFSHYYYDGLVATGGGGFQTQGTNGDTRCVNSYDSGSSYSASGVDWNNGGQVYWPIQNGEIVGGSPGGCPAHYYRSISSSQCSKDGGSGGGVIVIASPIITINGEINADGEDGQGSGKTASGAGSGGFIWLKANTIDNQGQLTTIGGSGRTTSNSWNGLGQFGTIGSLTVTSGDGGDGYIQIEANNYTEINPSTPTVLQSSFTSFSSSSQFEISNSGGQVTISNNTTSSQTLKLVVSY